MNRAERRSRATVRIVVVGKAPQERGQVVAGSVGHHLAVVEPHHPGDQGFERSELVEHDDDGGATVDQPGQGLGHALLALVVDARQRLVQHQHVSLGGEGPGDQRAPLLPARERRHPAAPVVDQPDGGDGGVDRVAVRLAHRLEAPEPRQPARGDDLAHRRGQGPRGALALGHVAEPVPLAEARRRYAEQLRAIHAGARPDRGRPSPGWSCPIRWDRPARRPLPDRRRGWRGPRGGLRTR